jgi:oxygen-independent coproporphyrinogen-3 oxidase
VNAGASIPLALYVHLPWCVRKCPYCDFNSHPRPAPGIPQRQYVAALLEDLEFAAGDAAGREISTVFFGGGTPSLFHADAIGELLAGARALFSFAGSVEVTLEANPGTIEHGAFAAYRDAGVTRVSLGAQSFDDVRLAALGRIHAHEEILAAVQELRAARIENFNLDLMYGLPQQTIEEALKDVETAIALGPAHISHYQLTLEPGTAFERRPPELPEEDVVFAMQEACQERLAAAGFCQYEVSAYSQRGRECRHNLNYWQFGDYIGVGAGAHGKLTSPWTGRVRRTVRVRQPGRYLGAARPRERVAEDRVVAPRDLPFEFMLNALRLVEGFEPTFFEQRTGCPWSSVADLVALARDKGLLQRVDERRWAATARGRLFLNDLQAIFLPGQAEMTGRGLCAGDRGEALPT